MNLAGAGASSPVTVNVTAIGYTLALLPVPTVAFTVKLNVPCFLAVPLNWPACDNANPSGSSEPSARAYLAPLIPVNAPSNAAVVVASVLSSVNALVTLNL